MYVFCSKAMVHRVRILDPTLMFMSQVIPFTGGLGFHMKPILKAACAGKVKIWSPRSLEIEFGTETITCWL